MISTARLWRDHFSDHAEVYARCHGPSVASIPCCGSPRLNYWRTVSNVFLKLHGVILRDMLCSAIAAVLAVSPSVTYMISVCSCVLCNAGNCPGSFFVVRLA